MEKLSYLDLPNCYRLSNESVELVVTTDVGPRILRYAFRGAENVLGEVPDASIQTELGEWKPLGGHRLWAAPEAKPRSYAPDNEPVEFEFAGDRAIRLRAPVEAATGLQKELSVALDAAGTRALIRHRITNRGAWGVTLAPWALTIMRGGGAVVVPQEDYRRWDDYLLPARPLVLWHYTDLTDPRFTLGARYLRLRTDATRDAPQKIGLLNKQGWAAYLREATLFVKTVAYREGASYPDYNSNTQTYTAGSFIELETLAPLQYLEPGESAEHEERWFLFDRVEASVEADEATLDAAISKHVGGVLGG
ncbi:MAG TPA: hypothetical protein VGV59_03710 [Pyrinomonadaceae bacterium]|nr:hypothetical protein [Pyrinomonadaceae bacterium]